MPPTVDITAPLTTSDAGQRIHYDNPQGSVAYRAQAGDRVLTTRHRDGEIVVGDMASGAEGRGKTYLDALRALRASV